MKRNFYTLLQRQLIKLFRSNPAKEWLKKTFQNPKKPAKTG